MITFDRRHWQPLCRELTLLEPDREVLALDLPGHGDAPSRASYNLDEVAEVIRPHTSGCGAPAGRIAPPISRGLSALAAR